MNIEEIRQKMTREEFINELKKSEYGDIPNKCIFYATCPSDIGLEDIDKCSYSEWKCKKCWLNSIKNIKFKGEETMKIWEVLKDENIGKRYKDNKGRKFNLCVNEDAELELVKLNSFEPETFSQTEIMTLEFEEVKPRVTGWEDVKTDKTCYFINPLGEVVKTIYFNDDLDNSYRKSLNLFSTKQKAEQVSKAQLLYKKMLKFYDEEDGKVDWNNDNSLKYSIYFDSLNKVFSCSIIRHSRVLNQVYFSNDEVAQRCIDEVIKPFIDEFGGLE